IVASGVSGTIRVISCTLHAFTRGLSLCFIKNRRCYCNCCSCLILRMDCYLAIMLLNNALCEKETQTHPFMVSIASFCKWKKNLLSIFARNSYTCICYTYFIRFLFFLNFYSNCRFLAGKFLCILQYMQKSLLQFIFITKNECFVFRKFAKE